MTKSATTTSAIRSAFGLAVICLGTLVAPLDSAVNIAMPSISRAFDAAIADIRWIVIAYVLTYSSLLLVFGKLGDLFGYVAHGLGYGVMWSALTLLLAAGFLLSFRLRVGHAVKAPRAI